MAWRINRRNKRSPIGLDIGDGGVRAVQLAVWGDAYTVSSAANHEWLRPCSEPTEGAPLWPASIRKCLLNGGFRRRDVVTALNPPAVTFHVLELPSALLTDEHGGAAEAVRLEIARLTDDRAEQMETRFWELPPTQASAPNAIGVAARREVVLKTLKACEDAGFVCVGIDAGATALCRFAGLLKTWSAKEAWGVLDIGRRQSRLVLCIDGVPVLVRQAGSGGCAWSERIADALRVSVHAAEVHKRDHGIAVAGRGVRRGADPAPEWEVPAMLRRALRTELRSLAAEVKRSYEYVLSCYPGRRAADLILVGGGAAMRNLPEFLGGSLGIPVRRASEYLPNDACRLRCAPGTEDRFDTFASAIGLALAS